MVDDHLRPALERSLRHNAPKVAVVSDGTRTTYAQLDEWSWNLASSILGAGIEGGQAVCVLARNSTAHLAADVALIRAGMVKVPINYMLPVATVRHIVGHSQARAIVTDDRHIEAALEAARGLDHPCAVLHLSDGAPTPSPATRLPGMGEGVPGGPVPASGGDGSDAAAIFYTGGTTGRPKGVVHSHRSLVELHLAQMIEAEVREGDVLLLSTPLSHAAGLFAQTAILRGSTIVLHDGFDVDRTLAAWAEEGVTWTFLVPTMLYRILDAMVDQGRAVAGPETIVYGAAPMSPERLREALTRLGPVFIQLYGQTECPNWGTRLAKSDHDLGRPDRLLSCGQSSLRADVKVIDDRGVEVGTGETGEVCLRSPYTLTRYHRDDQATEEKFCGGWIRTGDMGMLDEDGYLFLKDRRADMVISGGMNVYCREVEDVLHRHPSIKVAAVIGRPHPEWGEAVHAYVIADGPLETAEVIAWSRSHLAAYARPKSVEIVTDLPETPFGKVDKKALRAPYWAAEPRPIH